MNTQHDNKPLVSIGMPAYNGERYIRKALDSLLKQDYQNFELIVSNNASTDATLDICREYAAADNRIQVYAQSRNIGALSNFKAVLQHAQGRYFMWAAVDDYWFPTFISEMVEELEKFPDAGVAMSAVDRILDNGDMFDTIRFTGRDNPNQRNYYQMLLSLTSSKKYNLYIYGLFRTQLLKKAIQFMPEVPSSDRLFICQMTLATKFRYIEKILHIRMHHRRPSSVRLPSEKFNRMQNEDTWVDAKILLAMARMIYHSSVIPWQRKFYLPVAICRYGWLLRGGKIIVGAKQKVPPLIWNLLKNAKDIVLTGRYRGR